MRAASELLASDDEPSVLRAAMGLLLLGVLLVESPGVAAFSTLNKAKQRGKNTVVVAGGT